eukprot:Gb_06328 [translate_table: standard]
MLCLPSLFIFSPGQAYSPNLCPVSCSPPLPPLTPQHGRVSPRRLALPSCDARRSPIPVIFLTPPPCTMGGATLVPSPHCVTLASPFAWCIFITIDVNRGHRASIPA